MATRVGTTGYSGQSKTTGTSLALAGPSLTLAVGDSVVIGYSADAGGVTAVAKTGTCTLGAFSIDSDGDNSGHVRSQLIIVPVTGAGTLTALTLTHTSTTARVGEAFVLRALGAKVQNGDPFLGAAAQVSGTSRIPGGGNYTVPAGVAIIAWLGIEGVVGDWSGTPTGINGFDAPGESQGVIATSGGGAASNISGLLCAVLSNTNATSADAAIAQTLGSGRSSSGLAVWYAVAGNSFTATPADTAGITDSVSLLLGLGAVVDDTAGITDVVGRVWTAQIAPPDSAALTDAIDPARGIVPATLNDTAGITDALAAGLAFTITPTDTAGITDALAKAVTTTIADSGALTDLAALAEAFNVALADSGALTDVTAAGLAVLLALGDTAGITDLEAGLQGFAVNLADGAGVSDAPSPFVVYVRAIADPLAATDALALSYATALSDAATVTDALTSAASYVRQFDDPAGITDSASTLGSGALTQSFSDALAAADSATPQSSYLRALADTAGITDALAFAVSQLLADNAAVTDSVTPVHGTFALLADAATITDLLASTSGAVRALADTAGIVDAQAWSEGFTLGLGDNAALADALASTTNYELVIADTATVADALDFAAAVILELADSALLTDLAVPIIFVGGPVRWLAVLLTDNALQLVALDAQRLAEVRVSDDAAAVAVNANRQTEGTP